MRRDELSALGIQVPVLPTIVLGGLPGGAGWAVRLERAGFDVVSSGARADTPETVAAAASAVPHRPVKATGAVPGAALVECDGAPPPGAYRLDPGEVVVVDASAAGDPNAVARDLVEVVGNDPSAWWVGARGFADLDPDDAERRLAALVEGVRYVRMYLAKRQFD